tara:strand:- start:6028 stop:6819 length:792 start_codon:yes stop_codon:yes gene_type:complete
MSYSPPNSDDCTIDEFYGSGHPYNYCISTADDVLDKTGSRGKNEKGKSNCELFGLDCIEKNIKGLGKYMGALFTDPKDILDKKCDKKLGNKYVLKTNTYCIDAINGKQVNRYTYINNMDNNEIFGIEMLGNNPDGVGILPSSLSKATRINGGGLFSAIISATEPECKKVKLKCHILNKYKKLYDGSSNYVHIAVDEIENISDNIEDIISKTSDKNYAIAYTESFSNINNLNNFNTNKDILNDTYYFLLALILLYVIFKIIHKK